MASMPADKARGLPYIERLQLTSGPSIICVDAAVEVSNGAVMAAFSVISCHPPRGLRRYVDYCGLCAVFSAQHVLLNFAHRIARQSVGDDVTARMFETRQLRLD